MSANTALSNDAGVYVSNIQADSSAPPTATTNVTLANLIGDDRCYNQSYQAGISDQGKTDYILYNYIMQGGGYGPSCGPNIDVTGSTNPPVFGKTPSGGTGATAQVTRKIAPIEP